MRSRAGAASDVVSPPSTSLASAMASDLAHNGSPTRGAHPTGSSVVTSMPGWLQDAADEVEQSAEEAEEASFVRVESFKSQHDASNVDARQSRSAGNTFDAHVPSALSGLQGAPDPIAKKAPLKSADFAAAELPAPALD